MPRRRIAIPSRPDFIAHKGIIVDLYWREDKKLKDVMKIMKEKYGFEAT